ncbi:LOW QUALITY PROTEIN: apoptosis-resistant E3 ubiquitin protein ligase 1-like [Dendronephthya gigantea]|uniref:LOW QUALITY PROTEIN: apoptosis-resistant E3 ubiquitin protein ligase 1-like n=1 Tax=Dendronephthya gigantea TaxID=151771 RepID=UPI00106D1AEC|nr:LOW QUALITY PROTEIN: apoptosis-resistant E3 ubiquitin protein ligase 1-like [Dendronephthya gigantea]
MDRLDQTTRWSFWAFVIVVVCLFYLKLDGFRNDGKIEDNLHLWMKKNSLSFLVKTFHREGITSFDKLLKIDVSYFIKQNNLNLKQRKIFINKVNMLREKELELKLWLESKGLGKYLGGFLKLGHVDLEHIQKKLLGSEIKDVISSMDGSFADYKLLVEVIIEVRRNSSQGWRIVSVFYLFFQTFMFLFKWIFRLLLLLVGYKSYQYVVSRYNSLHSRDITFLQYFVGYYLDPMSCQVEWLQRDKTAVGSTASFLVKLYHKSRFLTYTITGKENVLVEISNRLGAKECLKEKDEKRKNAYFVSFHPKVSGRYSISVMVNGKHILGSPFLRVFKPGPVDMSKVSIMNGINTVVVKQGVYYPLKIETRDKYENLCELECTKDMFEITVKQVGSDNITVDSEPIYLPENSGGKNMLHIKLEDVGCFHGVVTCQGKSIINGAFDIVSLNQTDMEALEKATMKDYWHQTWYEGYLLTSDYQEVSSGKDWTSFLKSNCRKIYFYFSSRQLSIKEFYLKIIPYKLYSFRISPSTKVIFPENEERRVFLLDDGIQSRVVFTSAKRDLIIATFARYLLRNIGGAESFQDKRRFFYKALQSHHSKNRSTQTKYVTVVIDRGNILDSSYEATKGFSISKWCRRFYIKFKDEPGQDAGGLTREWISVLSRALFDPQNELFTQFNKEDKQALIYPNPHRPSQLKLKYFEFAGDVCWKCILSPRVGAIRRLNVKARFMRSFLAQLIGLRVNYKYFKTDDKQLYSSKIEYIQKVDPEDLNLFFSEEEYDRNGKLVKEVELIPDGSKIEVTTQNRMKYLDALAQYKLHTGIKHEVEAFIKGLNELIPDNLLTMFSEQELELLICGTSDISVNDLKNNHNSFNEHSSFSKVMSWFWKSIALFNQEEFARLLQFTTGSSQLPPGGFACLTPKFSFSSSPIRNGLPRAHTCFNQLVLPDYTSYEEFDRCLHLAITEGCEGFGFD